MKHYTAPLPATTAPCGGSSDEVSIGGSTHHGRGFRNERTSRNQLGWFSPL